VCKVVKAAFDDHSQVAFCNDPLDGCIQISQSTFYALSTPISLHRRIQSKREVELAGLCAKSSSLCPHCTVFVSQALTVGMSRSYSPAALLTEIHRRSLCCYGLREEFTGDTFVLSFTVSGKEVMGSCFYGLPVHSDPDLCRRISVRNMPRLSPYDNNPLGPSTLQKN
jgi:hypothetical protein